MTTTDPAAVDPYGYPPAPPRQRRPRFWEGVVALVCLGLIAVAIVIGTGGSSAPRPPVPRPSSSVPVLNVKQQVRYHAIKRLLAQRSAAILQRNRAVFAATLDPDHRSFRRSQLAIFANLSKIKFSKWSYEVSATSTEPLQTASHKYGVPAFAPDIFVEHYAIAGFDPKPTILNEYPTFVERSGHWYLTSLTDQRLNHEISDTQIWDYGPIDVVRRPRVLVIGAASELSLMQSVADATVSAIPRVTAVWGAKWLRRAVVQVPASVKEMGRITDDGGDLHRIAALTSSETSQSLGHLPVGDRITLNPVAWPKMSSLGVQAVITHELTHVATGDYTRGTTPKWLSEGFADYVGQLSLGLTKTELAAELTSLVHAGKLPKHLPTTAEFNGANPHIADAYEEAWMACEYLAAHYGQHALVRFYRAVGSAQLPERTAVANSLHSVFHVTPSQLVSAWRRYVQHQL